MVRSRESSRTRRALLVVLAFLGTAGCTNPRRRAGSDSEPTELIRDGGVLVRLDVFGATPQCGQASRLEGVTVAAGVRMLRASLLSRLFSSRTSRGQLSSISASNRSCSASSTSTSIAA